MKQTGICPKCQSDNILVFENKDKNSKKSNIDYEVIGAFGKTIYTTVMFVATVAIPKGILMMKI